MRGKQPGHGSKSRQCGKAAWWPPSELTIMDWVANTCVMEERISSNLWSGKSDREFMWAWL